MKFLSIIFSGIARTRSLYSTQYGQVFDVPTEKESKRIISVKAPVDDIIKPGKNKAQNDKLKLPKINYFAGPHCVFDPHIKY
ncbi:hypothetical protein FC093_12420 [Ilyomonas limi]|uniref:Uncharacterized protein n=1 Tax=Ilyomonas limi TaxID=2575867 RepID=A0A4U3KZ25_9BACT|nr:hypothetical protein [Ilyomonas limi]TKK68011.1 hypothetical protein FC093_12420 [Ilyomonas limi]